MKLSKNSLTEIIRAVLTAAISVLTTLGILSCTVYSGNQTDSSNPLKTTLNSTQLNDNYNY